MRFRASTILLFLICISSPSCTDFIASKDLQDTWLISEGEHVVLHYRPWEYSSTDSPTTTESQEILKNQELYYKCILDSIGKTFSGKILIYLFNADEAKEHIGTSSGGHAIPKLNTMYYTWLNHQDSLEDKYGILNPAIGAHEMAHILTHQTLGYPGTKLASEGYANWLDGTYARLHNKQLMINYLENHTDRILTPDQLLTEEQQQEYIYYPNAGIFTGYIIKRFGPEIINNCFTSNASDFKHNFQEASGTSWNELSSAYTTYLDKLIR